MFFPLIRKNTNLEKQIYFSVTITPGIVLITHVSQNVFQSRSVQFHGKAQKDLLVPLVGGFSFFVFCFLFFLFSFPFLSTPWYMELPVHGSDFSLSCNLSCRYNNSRSLTHCAGQGSNPCPSATSLIVSQTELPKYLIVQVSGIFSWNDETECDNFPHLVYSPISIYVWHYWLFLFIWMCSFFQQTQEKNYNLKTHTQVETGLLQ